jgi:drug/metabolite transporter (DMT)-like permease
MIGGLITSLAFGAYQYEPGTHPLEHLTLFGIGCILVASLVGTVIFYFLLQKLMKISSPFFVGFTSYIQLVMTIFAGAIIFDEHIGIIYFIGSILTIYGVYYINKQR